MEILKKRLKSLVWRLGVVMAVAGINYVAIAVTDLGLSEQWVVVVGLVAGEITKFLNSNLPELG